MKIWGIWELMHISKKIGITSDEEIVVASCSKVLYGRQILVTHHLDCLNLDLRRHRHE